MLTVMLTFYLPKSFDYAISILALLTDQSQVTAERFFVENDQQPGINIIKLI